MATICATLKCHTVDYLLYLGQSGRMVNSLPSTVKTEIIENLARTLELPLLVRSVTQVRAEVEPSRCVLSP